MPRERVEVPLKIEKLSVLSPDGKVDKDLEPKLTDAELRKLYKGMLLPRRLDERCLQMQRQGRIGTYGPSKGQEATPLGFAFVLEQKDWFVPSYRELAAFLWRGWDIGRYLCWWGGHEIGSQIPEGVNDLPISVPIASQLQYAMGIAWANKLKKNGAVTVTFVGDGGTSQGDFHEALNYATVYEVPLVTVIQNNHWAISVPRHKQSRSATLAQKAFAYGMDGLIIDGNDLLAIIVAARELVAKARSGGGPSLVEAITYRLMMHTTADDPKKYRSEDEVKEWEAKDPLIRFKKYVQDKGLLTDKVEKEIEAEVKEQIEGAIKFYETYQHDPLEMFHYMYAEQTPELRRQEAELRDYLENGRPAPQERTATDPSTNAAGVSPAIS